MLNQFDSKIKTVRFDNGIEFINLIMKSFFELNGIYHHMSFVYTPKQNWVVERKYKHILNVARSFIFQSGFYIKYWGDAILTSCFLINRIPTLVLKCLSPYELVFKKMSVFEHLRVFGSLCFATKLNNHDKFSEKDEKCVLLGYSSERMVINS